MKQLFLFLFSFYVIDLYAASCCVSNTSVSNLMILPANWQQTLGISQSRVIGDVNEKGRSTFRNKNNKDVISGAKLDLSYAWTSRYQSGVSLRYQQRSRQMNGTESQDSGWNDVGLFHAYRPMQLERVWIFQTLNVPTATSTYDSKASMAVDARGTGTYQSSLGIFGIYNFKEWDFIYSPEVHHSLGRSFRNNNSSTEVGSFWGTSFSAGVGYIPWRSKARYGISLTPRFEGRKDLVIDGKATSGKDSMVWDASLNYSYTLSAEYAIGMSYTDQTIFGPSRNSLLNRSIGFQFQTRWP